jgi:hypothetical protein
MAAFIYRTGGYLGIWETLEKEARRSGRAVARGIFCRAAVWGGNSVPHLTNPAEHSAS